MAPKPGLPPPAIANLKLILTVSNAYYAKILPLYRKSLEHRRLRRGKIRNMKGLRVKTFPSRRMPVTILRPRVPPPVKYPIPQPSTRNPRKRPASPVTRGPGPAVEPPCKKLRALTDATAVDTHTLSQVPLLKRLQDSLPLPSHIVLRGGRWLVIRQRGPVCPNEPPVIPVDLVTIRVPPGLRAGHAPK